MGHDNFPLTVDGDISIGPVIVGEFCHFGRQLRCGWVHPETAMARDKMAMLIDIPASPEVIDSALEANLLEALKTPE